MTLPLALSPHAEIMFQAATLGIFLVVSTAIWTWVFVRWRDGRPIIPLARRRPVPWSGLDVLFIFLMAFFLPISLGRAVETWLGSSADQQAPGPGTDLAHPAERLLGSRDPAAIVVALAMAVVVAHAVRRVPLSRLAARLARGGLAAAATRASGAPPGDRVAAATTSGRALRGGAHPRWQRPAGADQIVKAFLGQMTGSLLTLAATVAFLHIGVRATAIDLGWNKEKLLADTRLGLVTLLAVIAPVLALQVALAQAVRAAHIDFGPIPFRFSSWRWHWAFFINERIGLLPRWFCTWPSTPPQLCFSSLGNKRMAGWSR